MNKKIVSLFVICVIGLIAIFLIPKDAERIQNAVVNPENGDIAICYFDYSGRADATRVSVYTKNGEKLYSKGYVGRTFLYMQFFGEELCVITSRDYEKSFFDRSGKETDNDTLVGNIENITAFEGWDYSWWSSEYTCYLNGYEYCYKQPTMFRRSATLTISNGTDVFTIYESR